MLLTSVCAGIVVVPFAVAPVIPAGTAAVQLMVTPGVGELNVTGEVLEPEQIVCGAGENCTTADG